MRFPIPPVLAAQIEAASCRQQAALVGAMQRLRPGLGAQAIELPHGAQAGYLGPASPISRVHGLGVRGPVEEADLTAAEEFFAQRGEACPVSLSPGADPSAAALLRQRGYAFDSLMHVFVRPVPAPDEDLGPPASIHIDRLPPSDDERSFELFDSVLRRGFHADAPVPPSLDGISRIVGTVPGVRFFLAMIDASPAGGGSFEPVDRIAIFFGTSTIEAFRRRGVQTALLRARLDHARRLARGGSPIDAAVVMARPGSASERNIARAGFSLAYARVQLVRPLSQPPVAG
jgi:GNAT superfamily N-acetyltransferase